MPQNFRRRCAICETPLLGKKGHGTVTSAGVICGNTRYHEKLRRKQKRPKTLDKELEDMLYFELQVSEQDDNLLTEVQGREQDFDDIIVSK